MWTSACGVILETSRSFITSVPSSSISSPGSAARIATSGLICFASQSDLRKNRGCPEVTILGADQNDRALWGRECVKFWKQAPPKLSRKKIFHNNLSQELYLFVFIQMLFPYSSLSREQEEYDVSAKFNNRELKHRRFWATDGNRKVNVLVFGALSPPSVSCKGLILPFITLQTENSIINANEENIPLSITFSGSQKRLCFCCNKEESYKPPINQGISEFWYKLV